MKQQIGEFIWTLSEFTGIGLGRYAPIVFGWMIGRKGKKINNKKQ